MEIRKAHQQDDFEAIGNIYASSWKVAYQGIVPQDYLDALEGNRWATILAKAQYDAYVIMDGAKYAGTSSICAARDENMAGWGEVISIYLLPEYFGAGYAQPLLEGALNALQSKGYRHAYLWVLEQNTRARRFYEKQGFKANHDFTTITIAGKELKELRYVKQLDG